ncbi:hypothetical protein BGZ65_005191, partial [Modicella reniformis]
MALNPIARAVDMKDEMLLKFLIDYCLKCAKTYHPAYMAPVERCLAQLLKSYPDIVAYVFRAISYIPANNHVYRASHAVRASGNFWDLAHTVIPFGDNFNSVIPMPFGLGDNNNAVFTLRSQLPVASPSKTSIMKRDANSRFPRMQNEPPHEDRSYKIYVSPFQLQPVVTEGAIEQQHYESVFPHFTGKDFLNNPVVQATLRFTWHKLAFYYWLPRFLAVCTFFALVMAITVQQIRVSSLKKDQVPTPDEIAARYLPQWRPVFWVTIAFGFVLIGFEVFDMNRLRIKYFKSVYNYIDLAAFISPVVGCFMFLNTAPVVIREGTDFDGGPSQTWFMGFSILLLYMNLLLELRVFGDLGITLNIILNITRRIRGFIWIIG